MNTRLREIFRTRSGKLGCLLFFGWIVNAAACSIIALVLGGDALSGRASAGHFFLGNHGTFTEVSQLVFQYSRIHTLSMLATVPCALLGWLLVFYASTQTDLMAQEQQSGRGNRAS